RQSVPRFLGQTAHIGLEVAVRIRLFQRGEGFFWCRVLDLRAWPIDDSAPARGRAGAWGLFPWPPQLGGNQQENADEGQEQEKSASRQDAPEHQPVALGLLWRGREGMELLGEWNCRTDWLRRVVHRDAHQHRKALIAISLNRHLGRQGLPRVRGD